MRLTVGIRIVAAFEAVKGALVLLSGVGALSLLHRDARHVAEQLIAHLHLDAANHYPQIFLDAAARLTDTWLWLLATWAALYAGFRFVEAYGLWWSRRWAEWLAAISGGVYIPFEIYELMRGITWLRVTTFTANVLIVAIMIGALARRENGARVRDT
jgi:uncharacterized membrane protein (DUF2068 family)